MLLDDGWNFIPRKSYASKLIDFYATNLPGDMPLLNPAFEKREADRVLRHARWAYWTRIFEFAWRKAKERLHARVEARVRKLSGWMHRQGSAMRVETGEDRVDRDETIS